MGVGVADRGPQRLGQLTGQGVSQVASRHVHAQGERQPGPLRPHLPEIEHLAETHRGVGDLALVDQEAGVRLTVGHHPRDLVEGDDDHRRISERQAKEEVGRGAVAGDRDHPLGEGLGRDRLPGDHDRPVALPHRRPGIHQAVPLGDGRIGRAGHRRDLELAGGGAAVQRLDVLQHVLDPDAGDRHLAVGEGVEHERVVRVRAVPDPDQLGHSILRAPSRRPSRRSPAKGTTSSPRGAKGPRRAASQLSTYPPSSTDDGRPRLARVSAIGSPRSRNRQARAQPRSPIHR